MPKTVADCHTEIVKQLKARGENVYLPDWLKSFSLMKNTKHPFSHDPDIYVKGMTVEGAVFISGHGITEQNGKITIHNMRDGYYFEPPFNIEDLGLCDPICWYAHGDSKTYPRPPPPPKVQKKCPTCGHVLEK